MDEVEQQLREDLAAAYRLAALHGWEDTLYTHFSVRLPNTNEPRFLINPFGLMFDEVKASDLIVVDMHGQVIDGDAKYNPAGFTIHSAVHMGREDAHCVIHTHTLAGMAVAATRQGLLNVNQISAEFHQQLGYHPYEGIALNLEERERIVQSLGANMALILKNHGLLSVGETVADAFQVMFYLNRACEIQLAAAQLSGTSELELIPNKLASYVSGQFQKAAHERQIVWQAWRRKLDRIDPSYKD